MQVDLGVLRLSAGVVSSGYALLKPSQKTLVEIVSPAVCFLNHSSAATANLDRRDMDSPTCVEPLVRDVVEP